MQFNLIEWRKQRGLTQTELALIFGVRNETVGRWESGKTKIPKMVHMLIHYMNLPPAKSIVETIYDPERL